MNVKVTVPKEIAAAIAHFVNLADSKHEAFTGILHLGYETAQSEIILRHFDGNYDELMQALVCGYETPEDKVRNYYRYLRECSSDEHTSGAMCGVIDTLNALGIKIEGVNA